MTGTIEVDGGELSYTTGVAVEEAYHGLFVSTTIAQQFVWEDDSGMTPVWMNRMVHLPEKVEKPDSVKNSNNGDSPD